MRFTLYLIYWLSHEVDDERLDLNKLPFDVTDNVRIAAVSERLRKSTFDLGKERSSSRLAVH